eukprot:scaffold209828_cov23-Tisochrysis_lutea.AAC.1
MHDGAAPRPADASATAASSPPPHEPNARARDVVMGSIRSHVSTEPPRVQPSFAPSPEVVPNAAARGNTSTASESHAGGPVEERGRSTWPAVPTQCRMRSSGLATPAWAARRVRTSAWSTASGPLARSLAIDALAAKVGIASIAAASLMLRCSTTGGTPPASPLETAIGSSEPVSEKACGDAASATQLRRRSGACLARKCAKATPETGGGKVSSRVGGRRR